MGRLSQVAPQYEHKIYQISIQFEIVKIVMYMRAKSYYSSYECTYSSYPDVGLNLIPGTGVSLKNIFPLLHRKHVKKKKSADCVTLGCFLPPETTSILSACQEVESQAIRQYEHKTKI